MVGDVVVGFLRAGGEVLLCRREANTNANSGRWEVPSGTVEGESSADGVAYGIQREWATGDATLVRVGDPVTAGESRLHPYLFECESNETSEGTESEWVHATEIRRRETRDGLWRAYRAVSPTVGSVREDRTHGSAYVSVRALEVLRDQAGEGADWSDLVERASALLEARPSMAALENRVNRAMAGASGAENAAALERAAREGIDRALAADGRTAARAAKRLDGAVLTLSRSGTVEEALSVADLDQLIVLESRPDREGLHVAEGLADALDVTVTLDAAVSHIMDRVDIVLVGADTVLADGSVINKVGTRTAAVAAAHEGVPAYAVAAVDKISPSSDPILESIDRGVLTDDERVAVDCPLFDRTPPELITGVITEEGVLDTTGIAQRATEHARRWRWKEPNGSTG
ncbi:ribose 1,5-bisphosphate isomerase [Halalkalicoccus paucihalophilus]|uniref:Ribose 1,5-bisphosphate isomerase n=1 Tax=Halalkalicoccus paucihalophilus TaxID=1008153 RepID=A0A151AIY2_9EURY|nr:initiation factor 2B-like protein [Halalkalicoccus paucihalophilus]KYH27552.1 ribose 1,5-bisphosphate isomerase [Halalkalicoccus paucihalophilus]